MLDQYDMCHSMVAVQARISGTCTLDQQQSLQTAAESHHGVLKL